MQKKQKYKIDSALTAEGDQGDERKHATLQIVKNRPRSLRACKKLFTGHVACLQPRRRLLFFFVVLGRLARVFSLCFLLSCNSQAILSVQTNTCLADPWDAPGSERWDGSSPARTRLPTRLSRGGVKREPRGAKSAFLGALGHLQVTPQTKQSGSCEKFSQLNPYGCISDFFYFFNGIYTCQSKCLWSVLYSPPSTEQ